MQKKSFMGYAKEAGPQLTSIKNLELVENLYQGLVGRWQRTHALQHQPDNAEIRPK